MNFARAQFGEQAEENRYGNILANKMQKEELFVQNHYWRWKVDFVEF